MKLKVFGNYFGYENGRSTTRGPRTIKLEGSQEMNVDDPNRLGVDGPLHMKEDGPNRRNMNYLKHKSGRTLSKWAFKWK